MKKAHRFAKSDLNFRAGKVSDPAPETHPKNGSSSLRRLFAKTGQPSVLPDAAEQSDTDLPVHDESEADIPVRDSLKQATARGEPYDDAGPQSIHPIGQLELLHIQWGNKIPVLHLQTIQVLMDGYSIHTTSRLFVEQVY